MSKDRPSRPADSREARLGAALRANLARRKAQARSRAADERDDTASLTGDGDNTEAGTNPHKGHGQD
ncbi:hypothetical protein [Paracoccus sp. (in: a-proteobacteria)]|uniref:hypothetical protein n=1 Tax=Paracoccus sp. TaxID=267 RepID=UPI0026DF42A9|nr:hypothetical protein [Paracoccus sp. (in: a-proteobacteria)]MDO5370880.1 hypothetical protein [Paracoccus sp. (in: a-proteobacteria)]